MDWSAYLLKVTAAEPINSAGLRLILALIIVWWIWHQHYPKVGHVKAITWGLMIDRRSLLLFGIHQTLSRAIILRRVF